MVLQTKKIERDWILLTYDVSVVNNDKRDTFREDLKMRMGALYQNDSVYLLPKKIHSLKQIEEFAKGYGINVVLFGLDANIEACKDISKRYVKILKERRKNIKDLFWEAWDRLSTVERNLKDESLTGFHNKIKEVKVLYDHYNNLATKYGNNQDEWKIESLDDDIARLEKRFDRIMIAKKRQRGNK